MAIDFGNQFGQKIFTHGHVKVAIDMTDILYLQCDGDLTTIYLHGSKSINELKSLKKFESELTSFGFFRIHDDTLVNGKYITKITTSNKENFIKIGDIMLKMSRRRAKKLKNNLF
ncbi:MAG: LytTR family transcriptional regulator DNA-binding domain-containing protein [Bacteroidales bacterium]|jgi:two-component system LytT family response regulator|nr:LytTR family transcriptional regulator DNA-binding domain-containing protein [Bacteroidales bacterium]